jgi:hypothetical protein
MTVVGCVPMRKRLAILGAAAFIGGGCGGNETPETRPSKPAETTPAQPTQPKSNKPELNVYNGPANIPPDVLRRMDKDPLFKAINEYRARIYEKRRAKVLLGACATWPNVSGGFTATVNPGITGYKISASKRASFFVFSTYDLQDSSWSVMNGPSSVHDSEDELPPTNESKTALLFYRKDRSVDTRDVAMTEQPIVDEQNRVYFKDKEGGAPVMLTGLAPTADYSETNIQAACDALREHKSLPGILKA